MKILLITILILLSCKIDNKINSKLITKEIQFRETDFIPTFVISSDIGNESKLMAYDSETDTLFINTSENLDKTIGVKVEKKILKKILKTIEYHLNFNYFLKKTSKNKSEDCAHKLNNVYMRIGENFGNKLELKIYNAVNNKDVSSKYESLIIYLKKEKILDEIW